MRSLFLAISVLLLFQNASVKADVAYVEDVRLRALQMDMDKIGAETSYMFLNNESKYPEEQIDTVFGEAVFSLNAWITEMSNVDKITSETDEAANKKGTEAIEEGKKEEATLGDGKKDGDDDEDDDDDDDDDEDDDGDGEENEKQAGNSVGNTSNQPESPKPLPTSQEYRDSNSQSFINEDDDDEDGYEADDESDDSEEWDGDEENSGREANIGGRRKSDIEDREDNTGDREENIKATIDRLVGNVKRNRDDISSDDSEDLDNNDEKLDTDDRIENSREEDSENEENSNNDVQTEDESEIVEGAEKTEEDDESTITPPNKRQKMDTNPVSPESTKESVSEAEVNASDEENEDGNGADEENEDGYEADGEELIENIGSNIGRPISTTRTGNRKNNDVTSRIIGDENISVYGGKGQTSLIVERPNSSGEFNKEFMSNWVRVGNPADDATDTREEYNETARKADPKNDNDPLVRSKDF